MFVLGNVLFGLAHVLSWFLTLYSWVLIARAIVSWVSADPRNPIVYFLHRATDPAIEFVRRLLPMKLKYFPLDIAFLVLFGVVIFLQFAIVQSLLDVAVRLRPPLAS